MVLVAPRATLAGRLERLTPGDQAEASRIAHARRREKFAAGRALLRIGLSLLLDPAAAQLPVVADENGRPFLPDPGSERPNFSISHSDGFDAVALAIRRQVGVDIEEQAPADVAALAETVFSVEEFAAFRKLADHARSNAFLRVWTRKEAVLKAAGLGFLVDPRSVTVGWEAKPFDTAAGQRSLPGSPYGLTDLVIPGLWGAVAVSGAPAPVSIRRL